jgi:uncharacterized membrane protein YdjX (TVP38/TMEM64 family)
VTGTANGSIADTVRNSASVIAATARQMPRRRIMLTTAVLAAAVALTLLVPLPTAVQLRDWAASMGPWFPAAFLVAHIAVTVLPFPRTAFTLAAGLLFGPALGVLLAVVASTASAVIAVVLVRIAGWQLSGLVRHRAVDTLDDRLRERGWPTVLSLRLIPAVPFSVLNYAAGASAVRLWPYTLATLAGLTPGTAAVVILGDALTGHLDPLLLVVSLCTAAVGVVVMAYEVRQHRRSRALRSDSRDVPEPVASRSG